MEIILNRRERKDNTAIFRIRDREMIQLLLERGIDLNHRRSGKTTREQIEQSLDRIDIPIAFQF